MADETRLNELLDLVEQARAEGDSATEQKAIAAYRMESGQAQQQPVQAAPAMGGGIGGMFQSRLLNATQDFGEASKPQNIAAGVGETGLALGSGAVATPIAGLAGLGASVFGQNTGADTTEAVQRAMTYQPRTSAGQVLTRGATLPLEAIASGADKAGGFVTDKTGSPLLGALTNVGVNFAPALLTRTRGQAPRVGVELPEVIAAKEYVARTGIDWNSLSESIRSRLTDVAKSSGDLSKLDAQAVSREALLESLPIKVPATRGMLTRDPVQLRNEGNVSATKSGAQIRDVHERANQALLENLEILRGKQRGKASTPEQVGESTQGALREKLAAKKKEVSALYDIAEKSGETQGRVSPRALFDAIESTPDKAHFGWVESWLSKNEVRTPQGLKKLTLKEMEDLRQAAVARAMNGGTEGYYAGKIIRAIDDATEGAGGMAYQAARKARKEQALEFEETGAVARLVENKSRTDRATALEDTWRKTVLGGSIEDLRKVKTALLVGPDSKIRTAGRDAWRDMRAQTVQHIINEATKSVTRTEKGAPNITPASMERAIKSIGDDKLNEIFGAGTTNRLKQIMEATRIVKTEPPPGFKGSPTFANAIAFLEERIGGGFTTGVIRGAAAVRDLGKTGREVRKATTSPLSQAAEEANRGRSGAKYRNALSRSYVPAGAASESN